MSDLRCPLAITAVAVSLLAGCGGDSSSSTTTTASTSTTAVELSDEQLATTAMNLFIKRWRAGDDRVCLHFEELSCETIMDGSPYPAYDGVTIKSLALHGREGEAVLSNGDRYVLIKPGAEWYVQRFAD